MVDIQNVRVYGFEGAIRGMRNPYNSWAKSDSDFENNNIGAEDIKLCKKLIKAGSDHRKFMRMIHVHMDLTAPLYMLKELDQYKVGVTSNSCSTMHTIHKKPFEDSDFSWDYMKKLESNDELFANSEVTNNLIKELNRLRDLYLKTKDMDYWYSMIQLLPSSYNQMRTYDFDYETLIRMYFARRNHKLSEWHKLCDEILKLPYMSDFIDAFEKSNNVQTVKGLTMEQVCELIDMMAEKAKTENLEDYARILKSRLSDVNI